jgi:hypothetical protein
MHHFAKTGSGQTMGKTQKSDSPFLYTADITVLKGGRISSDGARKPSLSPLIFLMKTAICQDRLGASTRKARDHARITRKTPLFFEFSLCLSRACLGKMFVFIYKWRKKWRFVAGKYLGGGTVIDTVHTYVPAPRKLSLYLSIYLSIYPSIYLSIYLSTCIFDASRIILQFAKPSSGFIQALQFAPVWSGSIYADILIPPRNLQVPAKNAPFSQLFLCLSRACLGKMIVSIYKLLKNGVFRRYFGHRTISTGMVRKRVFSNAVLY